MELQRWDCVNLVGVGVERAVDVSPGKRFIVVTHHGRLIKPLLVLSSFVKHLD